MPQRWQPPASSAALEAERVAGLLRRLAALERGAAHPKQSTTVRDEDTYTMPAAGGVVVGPTATLELPENAWYYAMLSFRWAVQNPGGAGTLRLGVMQDSLGNSLSLLAPSSPSLSFVAGVWPKYAFTRIPAPAGGPLTITSSVTVAAMGAGDVGYISDMALHGIVAYESAAA